LRCDIIFEGPPSLVRCWDNMSAVAKPERRLNIGVSLCGLLGQS